MSQSIASFVPVPTDPSGDALVAELEPPTGKHALVIGHHTLETLCSLIRCGCPEATEFRPDEPGACRPPIAQIAVLPDPASLAEATVSVGIARRALAGGGRIAIRDADGLLRLELAALLRAQGFVAISSRHTSEGALVFGELPPPPQLA
jgi:hypothetical protein